MSLKQVAPGAAQFTPAANGLKDRVVLVTGATGGLGQAVALTCVQAGARVILLGRKVGALEKLYDQIDAVAENGASIYPLDLEGATSQDYSELATRVETEYGRLDGIVHAAAHLSGLMPAEQIKPHEWLRSLHVNLSAPFLLTQACYRLLHSAADASVVFVLEDPVRIGKAFWGGYGVAKQGLTGLVSILHQEWESSSIRVHALLPAPMRTALRRMAYFGEDSRTLPPPQVSASALVYLLTSEAASLRGQVLDLRTE